MKIIPTFLKVLRILAPQKAQSDQLDLTQTPARTCWNSALPIHKRPSAAAGSSCRPPRAARSFPAPRPKLDQPLPRCRRSPCWHLAGKRGKKAAATTGGENDSADSTSNQRRLGLQKQRWKKERVGFLWSVGEDQSYCWEERFRALFLFSSISASELFL